MSKKRPKGRPEPLGSLLKTSLAGTVLGDRFKDLGVWQHWEAAVGPAIARRARPLRVVGGVLTVQVGSAPWMQQLSFMKTELRDRLNSCLGEERIREIVLKSGRIVEEVVAEEAKPPVILPLSPQQEAWIDQQLQDLSDEELRDQLKRLMACHYGNNQK